MFSSFQGITKVRIEPIIHSMLIEYQSGVISRNAILRYISLFFGRINFHPPENIKNAEVPTIRRDLFRSGISGLLILVAYTRKTLNTRPDSFDYAGVISTAYTVLSHGKNNFNHPDVITGAISMLSLGSRNILHVTLLTWVVNLLEVLHDIKRSRTSFI